MNKGQFAVNVKYLRKHREERRRRIEEKYQNKEISWETAISDMAADNRKYIAMLDYRIDLYLDKELR